MTDEINQKAQTNTTSFLKQVLVLHLYVFLKRYFLAEASIVNLLKFMDK